MTNEEKARELTMSLKLSAILNTANGNKPQSVVALMEKSALEMAEWKDHQFKEYLEKKLESIRDCFQKSISEYKKDYCFTQMVIVAEIINELFPNAEQDNTDRDE